MNQRTGQAATDNSWWFYPAAVPGTVGYTANTLNQYTAVGAVTPAYDANGNLTGDGLFTYGYDAENRLTSATGAGVSGTYAYDAQGRRKLKVVNGVTTVFVTDANNREVLEYDGGSGQVLRWYAYGLGPNDVLNQMDVAAGTRATFIPDLQGSIIGTLDSGTGALSKRGYLPYGAGAGTAGTFAYTGQRIDAETNGLYYYRARMYAPMWGRFTQPDPIGYRGGNNLYAYVGNDPLNRIDPTGLVPDIPQAAGAGGGGGGDQPPLIAPPAAGGSGGGGGDDEDGGPKFSAIQLAAMPESERKNPRPGRIPGEGGGGGVAPATAPVTRALTAADLGVAPSALTRLQGTLTVSGGEAVVRVEMIQGQIGNPFAAIRTLSDAARNGGAQTLVIEGSVANAQLLRVLTERYGAQTIGGIERITIPLR